MLSQKFCNRDYKKRIHKAFDAKCSRAINPVYFIVCTPTSYTLLSYDQHQSVIMYLLSQIFFYLLSEKGSDFDIKSIVISIFPPFLFKLCVYRHRQLLCALRIQQYVNCSNVHTRLVLTDSVSEQLSSWSVENYYSYF